MAEAMVSLAVKRISELLIQEAVFLSDVKEEVESLNAQLKRMQSFLEDVDRKPEHDNRLHNRVSEIRDLAYDAEDVIDTFILIAAHQRGFRGIIKRFASIFTELSHLHNTKVQVKAIQTKLENISRSLPAFEISGEGVGSGSTSRVQQWLRRTYSHVEEEDVVSLEVSTKDVLAQLMTEEDRLHAVVSIVGMGGIGKTTLARKVYNHVDVRRHFDCLAWVSISQQWSPREVLLGVLMKVFSPSTDERKQIEKETDGELIKRLSDVLKKKLYLVVFDDIRRSEDWDILKPAFPRGRKGSKILFTTRNRHVALHADRRNSPMELPLLTDEESWNLLSRKAFPQKNTNPHSPSEEFEILGRQMVKQCGGLPLAIVVLGSLLATKQSPAQWKMIQRNIHGHLKGFQEQHSQYGAVKGILSLSYNDLPYNLKPCFLYLGHFPEDWEISRKELIQLWIAEGFVSPSLESMEMLLEDMGELYLEELINRSLVQIGSRDCTMTKVKTCRIHDLLRDLCMEKAREEKFLDIIHPPLTGNDADSVDVRLAEPMLRRIAIHPSKRYVCLKGEHPKLRSLLLFQDERLIKMQISKCKSFRFLRVLKVVKKNVWKWHVSSEIGNLHHLRFLKLEGQGIFLPKSIGRLKSLYTLKVVGWVEIVVPDVVFKMEQLRHISLKTGQFWRSGCLLRRFSSDYMETLKYVRVDKELYKEVVRISNIQSLGLVFERSKDVKGIVMSLIELHRLASLSISSFSVEILSQDLEPLSQCHGISKLRIEGWIEEDPQGRHHVLKFLPPNIVKLTLWDSGIKQDPMGVLEKLPCLRILRLLRRAYLGSKMICSANGFPQLDSLEMDRLLELEEWEIEEGAMPRLRSLELRSLFQLKMLPEGLTYITTLQQLKLIGMNWSLEERIKARDEEDGREGEDFYKVRHIPSLLIQLTW